MQRWRPSTGRAPLKLNTGTGTAARSQLPRGRCKWLAPPRRPFWHPARVHVTPTVPTPLEAHGNFND